MDGNPPKHTSFKATIGKNDKKYHENSLASEPNRTNCHAPRFHKENKADVEDYEEQSNRRKVWMLCQRSPDQLAKLERNRLHTLPRRHKTPCDLICCLDLVPLLPKDFHRARDARCWSESQVATRSGKNFGSMQQCNATHRQRNKSARIKSIRAIAAIILDAMVCHMMLAELQAALSTRLMSLRSNSAAHVDTICLSSAGKVPCS